jgi:hypothetical protein
VEVEHLQKKTLPISSIAEMFDNKSVAVIGNAESIFSYQFGNEIDNHDIVIRMNKGYIKDAKAQGSKTTIWAGSAPMSEIEIIEYFSPLTYMWMTPKISDMPKYSDEFLQKLFVHPKEIWDTLFCALNNTRPTTGMMVINFLLKYTNPNAVTLYGFDFFKTKSFYERKIRRNTPHNFVSEERLVYAMIEDRSDVIIKGNKAVDNKTLGLLNKLLNTINLGV